MENIINQEKVCANSQPQMLYRVADDKFLSLLKDLIVKKRPAFLTPLNFTLPDAQLVAKIFNTLICGKSSARERYKSFYCNSCLEAVHGAIKLARHYKKIEVPSYKGNVVFFDSGSFFRNYFDPKNAGLADALIPGIAVIECATGVPGVSDIGCAEVVVFSLHSLPDKSYQKLCADLRKRKVVTILDISRIAKLNQHELQRADLSDFDIICWGEVLTGFQFPFGAFSAREGIFNAWDNLKNCGLHSTTFGGNGFALSLVKNTLANLFPGSTAIANEENSGWFKRLGSTKGRESLFINKYLPVKFSAMNLDFRVVKAEGPYLYCQHKNNKIVKVLDCVGSSGCNALGHNQADIARQILSENDNSIDYFDRLNQKLFEKTGLERMIQAVSGASAVEIGLIFALLAQPKGKKILLFKGNFGGKTLVALNATTANHYFFEPLYRNVLVFDPFAPSGKDELENILMSGEVGVVWMEMLQGGTHQSIPPDIIAIVSSYKAKSGYFVGVDEVLNGIYRTGDFTSFSQAQFQPDIITFAKALSGMVMPVSLVMCSDRIYQEALSQNIQLVTQLSLIYKNQFSCRLADYMLDRLSEVNVSAKAKSSYTTISQKLKVICEKSLLIKNIKCDGLHIHINLNTHAFPLSRFGNEQSYAILTELLYKRGKVLCLFGRLLPALNIERDECTHLVEAIETVAGLSPFRFLLVGIKQSLKRKLALLNLKLM